MVPRGADDKGSLWVLDPATVGMEGLVEGGPKLMRFDLTLNRLVSTYRYEDPVLKESSYLNDVRIDLEAGAAYITDSGDGAIVVTDLKKGSSRRRLDDHPSTEAEEVVLTIEGKEWLLPNGEPPKVHADGIALSPDGRYLYYQALTGRTLYRVPTDALRDRSLADEALAAKVETVGQTGAADGLIFGADGWLYISALEENAIKRFDPETGAVEMVVQGEAIKWPDTFTRDAEGRIHFTTAQIHLGGQVTEPYRLFRIDAVPVAAD
jgi:sugar lactone lactonase YvrE